MEVRMKTKAQEKLIACQLRSEGKTVNEIAKELKVSKSSVSIWVREIQLTTEQIDRIKSISPRFPNLRANTNKEEALKQRQSYQEIGKIKTRQASSLFVMGCMLYWGEGSKNRNAVKMSNADPELMKVFIRFLREEFQVTDESIAIRISAYSNNGLICEEIQSYWLKILNLPVTCMRQLIIDRYATENAMKNKKKGKLPYGTCEITVGNTSIVQEIFGAIQEFGQFKRDAWVE
jgi:predicted transcriptional regulator